MEGVQAFRRSALGSTPGRVLQRRSGTSTTEISERLNAITRYAGTRPERLNPGENAMKISAPRTVCALLVAGLAVTSVGAAVQPMDDTPLAAKIAQGIIAACPMADPADEKARDASADKLARFALLRDTLSDPLYWGGHTAGASYDPADSQLTLFNPLVWRRMYLSLFMFPGPYRIERADPYLLLWIPYQFRSRLDMGAYPYPFWHSKKKWDSYQFATELILVFQNGKII